MSDVRSACDGTRPIEARDLHKTFVGGDGSSLTILDGVDLAVERGEAVAVTGASGAGKSTLLHILGALDRPTSGESPRGRSRGRGPRPTRSWPTSATGTSASSSSSTTSCASSPRWRTS